ncbi:MAG: hypothetical protein CM15mP3_06980 [Candidatus Poseidoniales archaeon]|nr:MAG: hypothetical protein CM15mP3_06980 [Candidatus Poseidoniales archaeon]
MVIGAATVVRLLLNWVLELLKFFSDERISALKSDGSVVTWGDVYFGGDSSSVSSSISSEVVEIFSTQRAFAALKSDGSVVTWGDVYFGGDSSSVSSSISSGVVEIFSTQSICGFEIRWLCGYMG